MKVRKQSTYKRLLYTSLALFLLTGDITLAEEWRLQPSVSFGTELHDNIFMTIFPQENVHSEFIAPRLVAGVQSEIWQINASAAFTRREYSDRSNLGRDSKQYGISSQYATERSVWQLSGNYSSTPVLISEEADPDVGLLQFRKLRKTWGIAPSWSRSLTERTRLQLGYQKSSSSYEDGEDFGLYDYHSDGITAAITHDISEHTRLSFNFGQSVFNVPRNDFKSDTTSIQGGLTHSFSDTLSGSLSAGAARLKSEGLYPDCATLAVVEVVDENNNPLYTTLRCIVTVDVPIIQSSTTLLLNANLEKKYEITSLNAGLSRTLVPSGVGTNVRIDRLDLRADHYFTPLLRGNISFSATKLSSIVDAKFSSDYTAYQVSPKLNWQVSREWFIETSFQYNHIDREREPRAAIGRAVILSMVYQPGKMSISR